ncbi:uncharacterized protein [Panulirus ornatus]|uniref:uncharacterized protein isoform X2 n=1 Tax=Panulirus ornatus TaxID=150431 RepID=UPI003A89F142
MSVLGTVDVLIKLGGSAITEKSQLETFKESAISEAVKLIKLCLNKGLKVIVVHGAGSFGHQQAKEYSVKQGWRKDDSVSEIRKGFSLTRVSCLKLHTKVVEKLIDEGVPAVGLSTLCEELQVKRVVFLTDVDGVYDKPPQLPDAKLIPNITVDENGKITQKISTDILSCDVTGGIELKLRSAIDIVLQSQGNTPVYVCKIGSEVASIICMEGRQPVISDGSTSITFCKER